MDSRLKSNKYPFLKVVSFEENKAIYEGVWNGHNVYCEREIVEDDNGTHVESRFFVDGGEQLDMLGFDNFMLDDVGLGDVDLGPFGRGRLGYIPHYVLLL